MKLGKNPYIESISLEAITNKRHLSSRKSSGEFNFELWKVKTKNNDIFYVTNQFKTVLFYCYEENEYDNI